MAEQQCWAIRHKPTGLFMPARMFKQAGAGWSYWLPGDSAYGGYEQNPRIFFTLQSARNALTMWLSGEHTRSRGTSYNWEGTPEGYDDHMINEPAVPRKREEMEIVPMRLCYA